MGFRESLDLTGIIDKFEAFGGKPQRPPEYVGEVPDWARTPSQRPGEGPEPAPVGAGPLDCSTSRQIAVPGRLFAWDPNRYYRDLGIPWPYVHATRKDLRLAYLDRQGEKSRRLTYCIKQLLNSEIRAEYDALPLGEEYLNDAYVQDRIKKMAALKAQEHTQRGAYTTAEQILDQWGLVHHPPGEETPAGVLDINHDQGFDWLQQQHGEPLASGWEYSFYLWQTTETNTDLLARWQAALIAEIDPDISPTLSVGLLGNSAESFSVRRVGDRWVVFLHHEAQVIPSLVASATTTLHTKISAE